MLVPSTCLPLFLLLLVGDAASAKRTLVRRASDFAARKTTSLARDLRLALAGVGVLPRSDGVQNVIYCKNSAQAALGSSGSTSGSSSASGSGSSEGAASGSTKKPSSTTASGATPTSAWHLTQSYAGSTFFDGWDFWNEADPTHGAVDYLSQTDAQAAGLVEINAAGNAVMSVETTPTVASVRKSIRITTQQSFTGGLIIMDAVHMPTGCATWPAFWSNGPDWPTGGEIDIVEGVNTYTDNQATIHTAPGPSNTSFGPGFNSNGGGVYAMKWGSSGISVFFFERASVPSDITAGAPEPTSWGLPMANWPAADCNPWKYFYTHVAIFDTTLCGDWAGSAWTQSGVAPGNDQSCAALTGYSTCEAFVQGSGASFAEAYWEVSSVKFYNTTAPL
ncbi:concanavalin A-like lectin/glucanase domain-containing protein [Mycena galopus ATCC 62051]|nr:concanavalin A-like lectin/glucanase domain-containing protein [Mycena galopus ATCC 62051]